MARRRRRGRSRNPRSGGRSTGMSVSIEGLDELRARLQEMPNEVKHACQRALRESADAIVETTKGHVKVDTGNLKSSVKARFYNNQIKAEIGWFDRDDRYAIWQEFGTRRRPPRPALGPALEEEKQHLPYRIKLAVRRVIP